MIAGSLADRDGRIQKGDRVLSINGRSTKGITHREALSILKVIKLFMMLRQSQLFLTAGDTPHVRSHCPCVTVKYYFTLNTKIFQAPRAEVVLVLSRSRSVTPADRSYDLIDAATYNFINSSRPPKILESPLDSKSLSAGMMMVLRTGIW